MPGHRCAQLCAAGVTCTLLFSKVFTNANTFAATDSAVPRHNANLSPNSCPPVHAGVSGAVVWRCGLLKLDIAPRHSGGYPHSQPGPEPHSKTPPTPLAARLRPGRLPIAAFPPARIMLHRRQSLSQAPTPLVDKHSRSHARPHITQPLHYLCQPSPETPQRGAEAAKAVIQRRELFPRPGFREMA